MSDTEINLGAHVIQISNPEKLLYPDDGITKADVVEYYHKIADTMLPHIQAHPLNMQRFPDGIKQGGFYEKEIPKYFPDLIDRTTVEVMKEDKTQDQVVCNQTATLVYLANQACITPHIWLSQVKKLHYPNKMIFDLDPPGKDFKPVKFAAQALRDILKELKLTSFLMTTGSRGLHVIIPLDSSSDFEFTRDFARDLVNELARREPDKLTTALQKKQREGKLFLDYLRNSYAQTSVPPYALRALPGAPVATPLDWEELQNSDLDAQRYRLNNIFLRLGQKDDPWKKIDKHAFSLSIYRERLNQIMGKNRKNLHKRKFE